MTMTSQCKGPCVVDCLRWALAQAESEGAGDTTAICLCLYFAIFRHYMSIAWLSLMGNIGLWMRTRSDNRRDGFSCQYRRFRDFEYDYHYESIHYA